MAKRVRTSWSPIERDCNAADRTICSAVVCTSGRSRLGSLRADPGSRAGLNLESRNDLWFSLIEDREILFLEVAHRAARRIAHHHGKHDIIHVYFYLDATVPNRCSNRLWQHGPREQNEY